jgi:hypothetical protein
MVPHHDRTLTRVDARRPQIQRQAVLADRDPVGSAGQR